MEIKFKVYKGANNEFLGTEKLDVRGRWVHQTLNDKYHLGAITYGQEYEDFQRLQFCGCSDSNGWELYDGDYITNSSKNNGLPHMIMWSDKMGAWVGNYGIEYLIAQELHEIKRVGDFFSMKTGK